MLNARRQADQVVGFVGFGGQRPAAARLHGLNQPLHLQQRGLAGQAVNRLDGPGAQLGLRLGAYELLRADGDDPVLILDDVFAELDTGRRDRLADMVVTAEQVLITAAVPADVPAELTGGSYTVSDGEVVRD